MINKIFIDKSLNFLKSPICEMHALEGVIIKEDSKRIPKH